MPAAASHVKLLARERGRSGAAGDTKLAGARQDGVLDVDVGARIDLGVDPVAALGALVCCLKTETRTPSARSSRSRMVTWTFMRSLGVSAGVYQSVMMTPPNGSAETSGMKLMVSSEARHR